MSAAEKLRIATSKECGGMPGHDLIICLEDGSSVGSMTPGYPGESRTVSAARAKRMVACWNACIGISTESLERLCVVAPKVEPRFMVQILHNPYERRSFFGLTEMLAANKEKDFLCDWLRKADPGDFYKEEPAAAPDSEIWRVS